MTMHLGMLLYPALTQLDLTGPFEILHRIPGAKVHLLWKDTGPVRSDSGLELVATTRLADAPPLDLLFVPGGSWPADLATDGEVMGFLRTQGAQAKYVTSVCTGALLLGAAGLLDGYRAATHWAYMDLLPLVGAIPVDERVVVDRNRITSGGVTAGIDFGLRVMAHIVGEEAARRAELMLQYDPQPPFRSGHPRLAGPETVALAKQAYAERVEKRAAVLRALSSARPSPAPAQR